jgi:hypothetical protein
MNRAMSGELHEILKRRTGIDIRGLKDPYPIFQIQRLREWAKQKKRVRAIRILDNLEKEIIIRQQSEIMGTFNSDISKLGLMSGNKELDKGVNDEIA